MPRRQRFKPSRKPRPAIEPENETIEPTKSTEQMMHDAPADIAEDRVPR